MKVTYQEKIDAITTELKIIMAQQRTVANREKVQIFFFVKIRPTPRVLHI